VTRVIAQVIIPGSINLKTCREHGPIVKCASSTNVYRNTLNFLQEEHQGLLQYIIPKAYNVTWAAIFSLLERHKDSIGIQVNEKTVNLDVLVLRVYVTM
jgi:hypothetical protein